MSLTAKKACEIFFEAAADTSWPRGDNWLDVASSSSDIKGSAFAKVFHLVLKSGRDISAQGGEMGVVLLCGGVENINRSSARTTFNVYAAKGSKDAHMLRFAVVIQVHPCKKRRNVGGPLNLDVFVNARLPPHCPRCSNPQEQHEERQGRRRMLLQRRRRSPSSSSRRS